MLPKWAVKNPKTSVFGEGLRAPFPCYENSLLVVKGGLLSAEGNPCGIIKSQKTRAQQIHKYGWT
jgi:hypothetical protein